MPVFVYGGVCAQSMLVLRFLVGWSRSDGVLGKGVMLSLFLFFYIPQQLLQSCLAAHATPCLFVPWVMFSSTRYFFATSFFGMRGIESIVFPTNAEAAKFSALLPTHASPKTQTHTPAIG